MLIQKNSIAEILQERGVLANAGVTFIEGNDKEEFLSYKDLYELAMRGLGYLQSQGIQPKNEVVLQIEDSKSFVIAFWSCILGGMIPVPVTRGNNEDHKKKLFNIWKILNNPYLIGSHDGLEKIEKFAHKHGYDTEYEEVSENFIIKSDLIKHDEPGEAFDAKKDDIAFIQFSSGSTGTPKGIILTHENLITNIQAIGSNARYSIDDIMLSWMPLTHDMGLIGFHLCPVYEGMNHLIMPTNLFVRRPSLWLNKASEHKATILCSPNFGYKYALKHSNTQNTSNLDLSSVRLLYNGAEPISIELCKDFMQYFEAFGLKNEAMCPVYGLAEASLAVSMSRLEDRIITAVADRRKLHVGDRLTEPAQDANTVTLVNVGSAVPECTVRITDENNQEVEAGVIGRVQIKGKNVTAGYYNSNTALIDNNGWLNTGDLGLLINDSLYITGREKDIIFVNGQNYYPHDIEQIAQELVHIELNKVAVVGIYNDATQDNEIIAFVFHRGDISRFVPLALDLKNIVNLKAGIVLNRIIPVKDIPRTTSGKLQRFRLVEKYMGGEYDEIESKLNLQQPENKVESMSELRPSSDLEKKIADIWTKVLGIADFTLSQKFLEIGGTSLKLAEVGMLIWKEFQIELPLDVLFEHQTIKSLAGEIQKQNSTEYKPISKIEENRYYPLSSSQKRLFYAWEVNKESLAYNNPIAFRINGKIDHVTLEDMMKILIVKNEVLRMSFQYDKEPLFEISEDVNFRIDFHKCKKYDLDSTLNSFVRPFDLSQAPLYRFNFVEVEEEDPILFLDFHHIIFDGISIYNLLNDLVGLFTSGEVHENSIDYKEFVVWEKGRLLSEKLDAQKSFWLNHLSGKLPVLDLPSDFARPSVFNTAGKKIQFEIGLALTAKLRKLTEANSCTLFTLMLTLYKLLILKYSKQKEVVVGVPVSGRSHPDLLSLYGMFVNNIAIKSTISGDDPFIQFLAYEKSNVESALQNQDYPFEALVEQLDNRSDAGRNPIFDTMFIFQNMGTPDIQAEKIGFTKYFFDPGFSKFDISMEIIDCENTLEYNIEYATEIFKEDTVRRFADHYIHLINRVLDDPNSLLSELLLISEYEYDLFTYGLNNTRTSNIQGNTIDRIFGNEVKKNPSALAVVDGSRNLTYQELDKRADELALLLRSRGVNTNTVVAILLDKSIEYIVSILGIMKAGGCYLPLDVNSPKKRNEYILNDSKCSVLITNTEHESGVEHYELNGSHQFKLSVINIDTNTYSGIDKSDEVHNWNSMNQLAYVIYTSGTTGNPKGVMIEHKSLANYITWASKVYVKGESGNFPLFTNTAFDLTITSIFTPLITGNCIHIYTGEIAIEEVIKNNAVNIVKLTPSHLRLLKEIDVNVSNGNINKLIVGGEALDSALAQEIYDKFNGQVEIYNEYGPTEATVGCMIHKFDPGSTTHMVPIGKPINNTQVYVLDEFLKPVPVGVNGELYVSGAGLARGYMDNEVLSSQKFIHNPFVRNQSMYKTGDIVKRNPDGTLVFSGRSDDQVKIRGYRVELSEIENSLKEYDEINEAIVIQKKIHDQSAVLIAYYIGNDIKSNGTSIESKLKSFLLDRLPDYMIPAYYIQLQKIPLTKNGKVDLNGLPDPIVNKQIHAPASSVETMFLNIWKDIFGKDDLGVSDNFFDLGGDSIKAVQIASRLFEKGIEINARDILRYHTIEQIALQTKTVGSNSYEQGQISGERGFTPIEKWFFEQSFENPNFYNQSVLLNFNVPIQISLVNQTMKLIVDHHDTLRTNYNPDQSRCFYNNELLEKDFEADIYHLNENSESLEEICYQIRNGFDITSGLLMKAGVFIENDSNYLFITAHHLVMDGVSWRILLEDFYSIYNALSAGEKPVLLLKTADMKLWENELIQFKNQKHEIQYWDEISNVDFVIPQDYKSKKQFVWSKKSIGFEFDEEQTNFLLTEANRTYKTDILTLLTTSLALTLKKWTNKDEYLFEFENHGRHLEELDTSRTMGWFTTMYPMKLRLESDTISNQILAIKEQIREVPHFGIGYGVNRYMDKEHAVSDPAIRSEIRFNYLGQFSTELNNKLFSLSNRPTGDEVDPLNRLTTKLELNLMIIDGVLTMEIEYSNKAFKKSTINNFARIFKEEMLGILDHIKVEKGVHFSPSDFDAVQLDDDMLASLLE